MLPVLKRKYRDTFDFFHFHCLLSALFVAQTYINKLNITGLSQPVYPIKSSWPHLRAFLRGWGGGGGANEGVHLAQVQIIFCTLPYDWLQTIMHPVRPQLKQKRYLS